jgi:anaerobic selenocysteine-containing dehydrogenase
MASQASSPDHDEDLITIGPPSGYAAGLPAVTHALKHSVEQMGFRRTAKPLLAVNQVDGFDCQGCAWPDPTHRHTAEFCENGAKAVTEEATRRLVGREFFAAHTIDDLYDKSEYWLGQRGRLIEPMVLREGSDRYEPISWDSAYALIGDHLRSLESPHEAVFYTSGKTSNEAAFLYQLFARQFGTNNLPDCSNMCHESTSVALTDAIGIGKGGRSAWRTSTTPS